MKFDREIDLEAEIRIRKRERSEPGEGGMGVEESRRRRRRATWANGVGSSQWPPWHSLSLSLRLRIEVSLSLRHFLLLCRFASQTSSHGGDCFCSACTQIAKLSDSSYLYMRANSFFSKKLEIPLTDSFWLGPPCLRTQLIWASFVRTRVNYYYYCY